MFSFLKWFTPKAEKSELSNPDIHKVPYGFYASHYRVLEYVYLYISSHSLGEVSGTFLKQTTEKSADKRASDLGRMGFLNVRVEKFRNKTGMESKRHYYSINKKGRQALINFNHKF